MKVLLLLLMTLYQNRKLQQRKIFILHGTASSCNRVMDLGYDQSYFICFKIGEKLRSLLPIETQAKILCQKLKSLQRKKPEWFRYGFYSMGNSQGGIIS